MAITITIQAKESRDDDKQVVFFTLSKDGTDYEYSHGSVPTSLTTDGQIKVWLKKQEDKLYLFILRKQYPGADTAYMDDPDKSDLENFEAWIAAGHRNKVKVGEDEHGQPIYDYKIIDHVPFKSNHPRWIKAIDEIEAISSLADAKVFLKKIVRYISR